MKDLIIAALNKHYPEKIDYFPIIDVKIQDKEILRLKETIRYEQFFFVVNLVKRKIENAHGLADWLGYTDSTFTLFDYIKAIHPNHLPSLNTLADSAFLTANSNDFPLKFMNPRLIVQIPLKHYNGKYLLVKRSLAPFQIDKSGKVLSYLNHFTILKECTEMEAMEIRVGKEHIITSEPEYKAVIDNRDESLKLSTMVKDFNKTEWLILNEIAKNPEITHRELCENLNLSLITLKKTQNINILKKARENFKLITFKKIKDVALFLKKEGLLKPSSQT